MRGNVREHRVNGCLVAVNNYLLSLNESTFGCFFYFRWPGLAPNPVGANLCVRPDSRIHACGTWADTQVCPYWHWPSYAFFISAGRVSPRRATGFLARARKSAKKACCAAWRRETRFAPGGRCAQTATASQTGEGMLVIGAAH